MLFFVKIGGYFKNSPAIYRLSNTKIKDFIKHPNPKCERLKCCTIDGYSIAVSIDTNPGTYVYFPIECAIDDRFLSANNLFRDKVKNVDKGQAGFFEDNCRVKIIKLQGYPSEGFITPITYLYNWLTLIGKNNEVIHKVTPGQPKEGGKVRKKLNRVKKVIDTQFRFHYDTTLIKKCPSVIHLNDIISITAEVHGTSGISAYVLCERPKKWYEKVFEFLTRKEIDDTRYDYLWSSRSVVKNPYYKMSVVSEERIREELVKCFKHDTSRTLFALCIVYKSLGDYIFTHTNLWLKPTNEK